MTTDPCNSVTQSKIASESHKQTEREAVESFESFESFEMAVAKDRLADWIDDYDLSPSHTEAMPDLIDILQSLVPSDHWSMVRGIVAESLHHQRKPR